MKKKLFSILFTLIFGTLTGAQAQPDPNFHIYLCWRQSNMAGTALVPADDKETMNESNPASTSSKTRRTDKARK